MAHIPRLLRSRMPTAKVKKKKICELAGRARRIFLMDRVCMCCCARVAVSSLFWCEGFAGHRREVAVVRAWRSLDVSMWCADDASQFLGKKEIYRENLKKRGVKLERSAGMVLSLLCSELSIDSSLYLPVSAAP